MKKCNGCRRELSLDEFNKNRTHRDGLQSRCRWCNNNATAKHYEENKQYYLDKARRRNVELNGVARRYIIDYLLSHPCVDCSNSDIEVLEFDHVDPATKVNSISNLSHTGSSIEIIKKEISKCEVRCRNCHIKKTRRQFGHWISDAVVSPLATN